MVSEPKTGILNSFRNVIPLKWFFFGRKSFFYFNSCLEENLGFLNVSMVYFKQSYCRNDESSIRNGVFGLFIILEQSWFTKINVTVFEV